MEKLDQLSPEESLDIITKAIQQTKENLKVQSFYYLTWGWLVTIAALLNYLLLNYTEFKLDYLPWLVILPIGWGICFIYSRQLSIEKPYETYIDTFLKHLWIVIGGSLIFAVFIAISLEIQPIIFILLLAGIGTLVSGLTMRFKPFIWGGLLFLIFSIISIYADQSLILLVYAIAIIAGYLIPAYILKKS